MMLPYAVNSGAVTRRSSPHAMLLIVSAHVALIAAVMSAKMDLPRKMVQGPPLIKVHVDPPPPTASVPTRRVPKPSAADHPLDHPGDVAKIALPGPTSPVSGTDPAVDLVAGEAIGPVVPQSALPTAIAPRRQDPRLLTPLSELKPPYPASKLASEQEATLTLRLQIDDRGRVTEVDAVGYADPAFLDAARRYMIAHWRYDPASDGDRPVPSSVVITLRFELDG